MLELVNLEERPLEVRRILAASLHELLRYKHDLVSLRRLNSLLGSLVKDPMLKESGVQTQLCNNLAQIIDNYFKGIDLHCLAEKI